MLKRKEVYRDPIVDYKMLMSKKRAPRWIKSLKELGYAVTKSGLGKQNQEIPPPQKVPSSGDDRKSA
jgi:hypothetical protein